MRLARLDVGSGPLVLLVPGFTGGKEDFRLVLDPLASQGFRVVAIDQRGQHESPGIDDPQAYSVTALAQDLLDVIDEIGPPAHVVGHSFGGLVARAAVLSNPAAVQSLTLLSSGPAALQGPRVELLPLLRPLLEEGGIVALADALDALSAALPDAPQRSAEEAAFLRRRFLAHHPVALTAMADALVTEPDRVEELARSGVRTQVVFGADDDAWSPQLQTEMAQRLGVVPVVIDGAAHSPAVENPAALVEALVAFLRD